MHVLQFGDRVPSSGHEFHIVIVLRVGQNSHNYGVLMGVSPLSLVNKMASSSDRLASTYDFPALLIPLRIISVSALLELMAKGFISHWSPQFCQKLNGFSHASLMVGCLSSSKFVTAFVRQTPLPNRVLCQLDLKWCRERGDKLGEGLGQLRRTTRLATLGGDAEGERVARLEKETKGGGADGVPFSRDDGDDDNDGEQKTLPNLFVLRRGGGGAGRCQNAGYPTFEDLIFEDPTFEDPTFEDPTFEDLTFEDPTFEDPTFEDPTFEDFPDI
ncbi:hypothetical protein niasHT_004244 [Heterodera trifolii]|uniref:Uncharacterized protein n=1 Tax=Heterodera trifolii TaxID=157864 RepID=A0ABD2MCF4_9BILA